MAALLKVSSVLLLFTLLFLAKICSSNKVKNVLDNKMNKIKQRFSHQMKSEEVDEIASKLSKLRGMSRKKFGTKKGESSKTLSSLTAKTNGTNAGTTDVENKGVKSLLFQGDMMLTPKQLNNVIAIAEKNEINATSASARSKRQAMVDGSSVNLFNKDLDINYRFDDSFTSESNKDLFRKAAADWSDHSCLNLVEGTGSQQIVVTSFLDPVYGACFSWFGYREGGTEINLYDNCELYETYAHEIGHSLGFFHTFARWDRDEYVEVVAPKKASDDDDDDDAEEFLDAQFKMETEETNNNFDLPYDLESIMHYPSDPTTGDMRAKDSRRKYIVGSENLITFTDYNMLNKLYQCEASCPSGEDCQNGGFRNPKDCDVCICPRGYSGNDCSEEATHEYTDIQCGGVLTATSSTKTKPYKLTPNVDEAKIEAATCNWHIHAPACKQVKVKFTSFVGPSINKFPCSNFGLEFRGQQIEIAGFRICKSTQANKETYTSENNYAVVSAFSKESEITVGFSYWYVDNPNCCEDLRNDCSEFVEGMCTDATWGSWMAQYCPSFCGVC